MFINPEMLQIDSFGYSILLEIYGKIGDIESAFHLPIDVRMPLHI